MIKVYVVGGSSGEYEDFKTWDVCACSSENKAKEIVDKLTELNQFNFDFAKKVNDTYPYYYGLSEKLPPQPQASEEYIALNGIKKTTPELKQLHKENLTKYLLLSDRIAENSRLQARDECVNKTIFANDVDLQKNL